MRERREQMNVCAIRRIETIGGLHPAFVWAIYRTGRPAFAGREQRCG